VKGVNVLVRIAIGASGGYALARSLAHRLRIASLDRAEGREREAAAAAGPTVAERQAELMTFYRQYEELVDVLCDAAQYGPGPRLEARYVELQTWMRERYPQLRRFVVAYLRYSAEDARQSLHLSGRSADAFEALVAAPNLEEFLQVDDGSMISRIHRTREALNLYGEHLRQLAAAQTDR
jgi:hypothetical protein